MGKTIEEVNRKLIHELSLMFTKELHDDATIPYHTCKDALTWLFSQPLASRLTAEEKERVRKMYKGELEFAQFCQRKANSCCNQQCRTDYEASRDIAKSRANMLKSIFGAEMFNEKEK